MTTGCEPATDWWVHGNGRWVVGEAGRQPETVAVPAEVAGTRPDTSCDGARLGDLDYRAVTLRGLSHCQAGKPRQDAYLLRISANREWLVGCVADGVSAAQLQSPGQSREHYRPGHLIGCAGQFIAQSRCTRGGGFGK